MAIKAKPETKFDIDTIQKTVYDILKEATGDFKELPQGSSPNDETEFYKYGMDTLDIVEFIMNIEKAFNISSVGDEEWEDCKNTKMVIEKIIEVLKNESRFIENENV